MSTIEDVSLKNYLCVSLLASPAVRISFVLVLDLFPHAICLLASCIPIHDRWRVDRVKLDNDNDPVNSAKPMRGLEGHRSSIVVALSIDT